MQIKKKKKKKTILLFEGFSDLVRNQSGGLKHLFYSGVMGKGTLQDILSDEKITLDDMFKSSMIGDAAKVISYIACLIYS